MHSVANRVQWLIDTRHRGNVRAAARDTGVPQPTLIRIVNGSVANPRTDALQKLARFYDVSVGWILAGEGKAPDVVTWYQGHAEVLRWNHLVMGLELDKTHPDLHRDLLELPNAIPRAAVLFGVDQLGGQPKRRRNVGAHEVEERLGVAPGFLTARQRELEGWLAFFEEWITRAGKEAVCRSLVQNARAVHRRFTQAAERQR